MNTYTVILFAKEIITNKFKALLTLELHKYFFSEIKDSYDHMHRKYRTNEISR